MSTNNLARYPISQGRHELLHYPGDDSDPIWVNENEPMALTLMIDGVQRGRSAAYFEFIDSMGRRWPMFLTDLADVLENCDIKRGKVSASWRVRKRGQNYGIALAEVPE